MKVLQNLHTHTEFCDGKSSCRELVERAIELGFKSIGFSGHGYTPFSLSYCMTEEKTEEYIKEVNRLKEEYKGLIDVYLGVEYDLMSAGSLAPYDYVIGSVHYFRKENGEYYSLDIKSPEMLKTTINEHFNGNPMEIVKCYYELLETLPDVLDRMDVVGHLDLITKSNDLEGIINTECEEYRYYASKAISKLVKTVGIFEINTGAVARGIKKMPYPDKWLLKEIKRQGGKVIISSDCHIKDYLDFLFCECVSLAKECGFKEIMYFNGKDFIPQPI